MQSFKEYFLASIDEVKAGRAWSGKIKRIDELMSWMYDNDILNKSDKAKKDSLFRKYYRFYNDGDVPKGKNYPQGWGGRHTGRMPDNIRTEFINTLEGELEDFIKKTLKKYKGKYDRKDFLISAAEDAKRYAFNGSSVDPYWAEKYASRYNLPELTKLTKEIKTKNEEAIKIIKEHFEEFSRVAEIEDTIK